MEKDSNKRSDEQSKQQFFSMHDLEEELRLLDQQPSFGFLAKDAVRPLLTVENAKKSGETLRPLNCLSLIYLLVNNVTNAWNYCKRVRNLADSTNISFQAPCVFRSKMEIFHCLKNLRKLDPTFCRTLLALCETW